MSEAVTVVILALSVLGLSYLGCSFALLQQRGWLLMTLRRENNDSELGARLMQLRAAHNLCERQLNHQFEVNERRLVEVHRLQAEVRALKFEREARESDAESRGCCRDEVSSTHGCDRQDGVQASPCGTPTDDGVVDRADEVDSGC